MSEHNEKKGKMAKDTVIYMLAKAIEGIVGVLTLSAMSYIYLPEQMGKYSTVNIAITTVAMISIQWLVQSALRYINKYDLENMKEKFFSTIFFSWLKVNLSIGLVFSFIIFLLTVFKDFTVFKNILNNYPISLISTSFFMFFTYNTSQLVIALIAGSGKSKLNLFISITNVIGKFLSIIILNNIFKVSIEWIFLSYVIFDFLTSVIGIIKLKFFKYVKLKENSSEILNILKIYGMPLMGNMFATSILNKSDIYIIKWFLGDEQSGIYQTNYSIIASAFTLLLAGAMRGSYPTIVRTWSEGKKDMAEKLIEEAVRVFLIISIPSVIGISILSDYIAISLFESKYFEGHQIMGFVAMGMMFLGLTEYAIKPWELNSKTKEIFKRSMVCGILNIVLNLALIKIFGYKVAGFNTFLAFFIYFLLAKSGTKKYTKYPLKIKSIYKILLSGGLMGIIILFLKKIIPANILSLCILVITGGLLYITFLYITGEIKNEINNILKKFKIK